MEKSFHDHFSGVSGHYAAFRPHYPAALFDYLAELAPRRSLAWDCAAGSGQASVDLAARFDSVVATDASPEQISAASPHPGVEYRVALAEKSGLADGSVDLVTVAQALHWLDREKFWHEAGRVLTRVGVIAVWAYGGLEVEGEGVNRIIGEFYSGTVGPFWPPQRALVEQGYRGISFPFDEISPPTFHMEAQWTLDQLIGYLGTWSATTRFITETGQNPLGPLAAALAPAWGNVTEPRRVTWPLALRVGRKAAGDGSGVSK